MKSLNKETCTLQMGGNKLRELGIKYIFPSLAFPLSFLMSFPRFQKARLNPPQVETV